MAIYFVVFGVSIFNMFLLERFSLRKDGRLGVAYNLITGTLCYIITFLPLILFYGLRVGIGTDYWGYVRIYHEIKDIPFLTYIQPYIHPGKDIGVRYYVEIGYFMINRITRLLWDNEQLLFFLTGLVFFAFLYKGITNFDTISYPFALYIFLMVLYCNAVNGVRQSLAYCIVLISFKYLLENDGKKYVCGIIVATLFHDTAACCILFWLLRDFKSAKLSRWRDAFFIIAIILTPVVATIGIRLAMKIPVFVKYFQRYAIDLNNIDFKYLWRCLPVVAILGLLIVYYKIDLGRYKVLFNIDLCRIVFLYLGKISLPAGSLDRYALIAEIILVPYVVRKIHNQKNRLLIYGIFVMLYFFYFFIWFVVQGGQLFPYRSIFSQGR